MYINKRVLLIVIVVAAFITSIFSGCSVNKGVTETQNDSTEKIVAGETGITFPLKEKIKVKVMSMDFGRTMDKKIDKELEKRLNIEFDWNLVPGSDLVTKQSTLLASGDLPDMMIVAGGTSVLEQYDEMNYFVDFLPYYNSGKMPNTKKWKTVYDSIDTILQYNGRWTLFPNFNKGVNNMTGTVGQGWMYRQDVFDKNNIAIPKTLDEVLEAAKSLKLKYPDLYPIVSNGQGGIITTMCYVYRLPGTASFYVDPEDMQVKFTTVQPVFKEVIKVLNNMYKGKILDPEFATSTSDQNLEKFVTGKTFIGTDYWYVHHSIMREKGKQSDPDFKTTLELLPINPYGKHGYEPYNYMLTSNWSIGISNKSKYIDELVAFIDYRLSDEIIELINWGIEDETFIRDGNSKKFVSNIATGTSSSGQTGAVDLGLDGRSGMWAPIDLEVSMTTGDPQDMASARYLIENNDKIALYTSGISNIKFSQAQIDERTRINTPLQTYVNESVIKFIVGDLDVDKDWDAFQNKMEEIGYKTLLKMNQDEFSKLPADKQKFLK